MDGEANSPNETLRSLKVVQGGSRTNWYGLIRSTQSIYQEIESVYG